MNTELHLVITAETAREALDELVLIGKRAAAELGVGQDEPNIPAAEPAAKGNGAEAAPKRTRSRAPATPKPPSRDEIVKGLTDLFVDGDQDMRDRITAFRDQHGVQRLRELPDAALPYALSLLTELSAA